MAINNLTQPGENSNSEDEVSLQELGLFDDFVEIETVPDQDLTDKLACAICYQPYLPSQFTVVSKERLNFESAVVVCPQCLAEMQAEVQRRTVGADLVLGSIWGAVATLLITGIMGWLIWLQRADTNNLWWSWVQAYLAVLPGWIIGKAIFIGVGRKASIWQQFMAVAFTLLSIVVQYYIVQVSYPNFLDDITHQDGHPFESIGLAEALRLLVPNMLAAGPVLMLVILATSLVGLATAWFVSEGPRLYTRPFVQPERIQKSRLAQLRQFLNI